MTKNGYSNGVLHLTAISAPDDQGIQWLLEVAKIDIEHKGPHGMTPFLSTANTSNLAALKILHQAGTNTQAEDIQNKNALHFAVLFDSEGETIHWLIHTAHIPIAAKNHYGMTPFLCTAEQGNLAVLKMLKKKGGNVDSIDKNSDNALHLVALFALKGQGIHWLIHTAHIPIETKENDDMKPFLCAAEKGNLAPLQILKEEGANVNAKNKKGQHGLDIAKDPLVINWFKKEILTIKDRL